MTRINLTLEHEPGPAGRDTVNIMATIADDAEPSGDELVLARDLITHIEDYGDALGAANPEFLVATITSVL